MRCIIKILSAITKGYMLRLVQAIARINPPESRTLKQAPCQVLLFAYKSIYTDINSGILIRGLDPSLREHGVFLVFVFSLSSHFLFSTNTSFRSHLASKMSSTGAKRSDGRISNRIENYTKFWNADPLKEQDADNAKRLDSYTDVVNGQFPLWPMFVIFVF